MRNSSIKSPPIFISKWRNIEKTFFLKKKKEKIAFKNQIWVRESIMYGEGLELNPTAPPIHPSFRRLP